MWLDSSLSIEYKKGNTDSRLSERFEEVHILRNVVAEGFHVELPWRQAHHERRIRCEDGLLDGADPEPPGSRTFASGRRRRQHRHGYSSRGGRPIRHATPHEGQSPGRATLIWRGDRRDTLSEAEIRWISPLGTDSRRERRTGYRDGANVSREEEVVEERRERWQRWQEKRGEMVGGDSRRMAHL